LGDVRFTPESRRSSVRGNVRFVHQKRTSIGVTPDIFTAAHRQQNIALAARYRLPAIYAYRYFATNGGLMSYGIDPAAQCRQAAVYVDRILRGTTVGALPIQAPTKFELIINLKTAKTLGVNLPPTLP
jgi:putative ABC transport system substrate-binding protein